MTDIIQILVTGISSGALLALVALGYSITFTATRVVNFAQGELLMIGAVVTTVLYGHGLPLALSAVCGVLVGGIVGALTFLIAIRPVLRDTRVPFAWLVTTLGASIVIQSIVALTFGTEARSLPPMVPDHSFQISGVPVSWNDVLTLALGLLVIGGYELFYQRALWGKVMGATAEDPEMASAFGVNRHLLAASALAASGVVVALAGILAAPTTFVQPFMGTGFGIQGFIAILIGGLGAGGRGALLGGMVVGIAGAAATVLVGPSAQQWLPLALIALVLLIRPQGVLASGKAALAG
jgi:branched-chain amino acid transport system permease protein